MSLADRLPPEPVHTSSYCIRDIDTDRLNRSFGVIQNLLDLPTAPEAGAVSKDTFCPPGNSERSETDSPELWLRAASREHHAKVTTITLEAALVGGDYAPCGPSEIVLSGDRIQAIRPLGSPSKGPRLLAIPALADATTMRGRNPLVWLRLAAVFKIPIARLKPAAVSSEEVEAEPGSSRRLTRQRGGINFGFF